MTTAAGTPKAIFEKWFPGFMPARRSRIPGAADYAMARSARCERRKSTRRSCPIRRVTQISRWAGKRLLRGSEAADGLGLVVMNVENSVELGYLKEVTNLFGKV
jgi:hypothetical protein